MRAMRIEEAMKMYLELFLEVPSPQRTSDSAARMYEFNALLAARKMGFSNIESAESLLQKLGELSGDPGSENSGALNSSDQI